MTVSIQLSDQARDLLARPDTIKVLASVDVAGVPHVTFKQSLALNEEGQLQYWEILESSQTNKNLTVSIWFQKPVAISLLGADHSSRQIKGVARRAIISGPQFEKTYQQVRESLGPQADLSTIWIIDPLEEREETLSVRIAEERRDFPLIGHLDRFAE
jgi:hypothetical protein